MDIKSPKNRSTNMSKIKSTNTKPEMFIRSLLHKSGLRYRINYSCIEGKPDLFFTKLNVAIFIHGCFWHRHQDCKFAYTPKSNVTFWNQKFISNMNRDKFVQKQLAQQKVRVLVIWECSIKKMAANQSICDELKHSILDFIFNSDTLYKEL